MLNSGYEIFDDSEEGGEEWCHSEENSTFPEQQEMTQRSDIGGPQTLELNTHKAGMKGLDTVKINEIIQKASKGSKFYHHKEKCQERIDARILEMKSALAKLTEDQVKKAEAEMTKMASEMEMTRDLSRTIVHIDMDMFYAAVEMRDDPSLRDKPMAVGSNSMLSTSNYIARKFGVRAAMPGFIGKKLCPDLVIVPCNFDKYKAVSAQICAIFEGYDPNFCPMSLDEAYVDITEYLLTNGHKYSGNSDLTPAEAVVDEIRKKIQEVTHLTASAGIAPNTRLAKVCSDMNKPDGQFYLAPEREAIGNFIGDLPVRKVSGVGNVSEQLLRRGLGITTCSDLWNCRGLISLFFSETTYTFFLRVALGLGSTEVTSPTEKDRKSISNETTFGGTSDRHVLAKLVQCLCKELKSDMSRKGLYGKVFTLKVKTTDFEVRTRAKTLHEYTQDESVMNSVGQKLLFSELDSALCSGTPLSLRLLGVRMSTLVDKAQLSPKKQTTLTHIFKKSSGNGIAMERIANDCSDIRTESKSTSSSKLIHISESSISEAGVNGDTVFIDEEVPNSLPDVSQASSSTVKNSSPVKSLRSAREEEMYVCPVCSKSKFNDMEAVNDHLDICLNSQVVEELVRETNSYKNGASSANASRGSTLTEPNKGSKLKRKCPNFLSETAKKQKSPSVNTLRKYLEHN